MTDVDVHRLRMAALLHDTARGRIKIVSILEKYGAAKVSDVKPEDRLACFVELVEEKQKSKYDNWLRMS